MSTTEALGVGWKRRPVATAMAYGGLVVGGILFVLPFLWLVSTSLKVNYELHAADRTLLPREPTPRHISPWVDRSAYAMPEGAREHPAWPMLTIPSSALQPPGYEGGQEVQEQVEKEMREGLFFRLAGAIPPDVWNGNSPALEDAVDRAITPHMLENIRRNTWRQVCLGALWIRGMDLENQVLLAGTQHPGIWTATPDDAIEMGVIHDAGTSTTALTWDLRDTEQVDLTADFSTSFSMQSFYRLQLAMRPDDGWQRLNVTVHAGKKAYRSKRPVYLSNHQWMTTTWQVPGIDEESLKIRTWLPLTEIESNGVVLADDQTIRITLHVQRSSLLQAWYGKLVANYYNVFQHIPVARYTWNSLYLIVLNVLLMLFSSSIVAYGVSRLNWPGRDLVFFLILATLMLPEQVTMIPSFLIWKNLGLYNTLVPLWLGSAFGAAFNIFLLRQFMKGIPRDLEDAGRIDGCGVLRIYWHIILPMVRPAMAAIALFTAVGVWNDFKGPLLYVADQRLYTLSFGLYAFSIQVNGDPVATMAASVLTALPVIVLFFFAQRHFVEGVTLSGGVGK